MSFADKFLGALSLDSRVISTRTSKCKPSFRDEEREGLRQERLRARQRAAGEAKEVEEGLSTKRKNSLSLSLSLH